MLPVISNKPQTSPALSTSDDLFESSLSSVQDFSSFNEPPSTANYSNDRGALQVGTQQRFDVSRRKLAQISIALKSSNDRGKKAALLKQSKNLQVYSTLLYLSLMMHKVEEIKMLLKENDAALYVENRLIFDSMKSPAFHLQHQAVNMAKAKKIFDRKQVYKLKFDEEVRSEKRGDSKCGGGG